MEHPLDVHRWLATALRRTEALIGRLREKTALDEDWLDGVERGAHALFRDLAVAAGLSARASDWAALGEADPLEVVRAAKPHAVTRERAILDALAAFDCWQRPEEEGFRIAASSADAFARLRQLLLDLQRLRSDAESDRLQDRIEETLAAAARA